MLLTHDTVTAVATTHTIAVKLDFSLGVLKDEISATAVDLYTAYSAVAAELESQLDDLGQRRHEVQATLRAIYLAQDKYLAEKAAESYANRNPFRNNDMTKRGDFIRRYGLGSSEYEAALRDAGLSDPGQYYYSDEQKERLFKAERLSPDTAQATKRAITEEIETAKGGAVRPRTWTEETDRDLT